MGPRLTRRGALFGAASVSLGAAATAGGLEIAWRRDRDGASPSATVDFYGDHQAGIVTSQQARLHFAALDVTTDDPGELRGLLRAWTVAAARLTRGLPAGDGTPSDLAPPDDTGEAGGLGAERLTITFGVGRTLFERDGKDRLGIAARRPAALEPFPPFAGEELDASRSDGDLGVQACADDPMVAFHAVRNLARIGRGVVTLRWSQLGFGRGASTSRDQETPRNVLGFKDGTNNLKAEDASLVGEHVWTSDGPAWMRGGSYLAVRRVRTTIEAWDRDTLGDQQRSVGRHKATGAPLGHAHEFSAVDLAAAGPDGLPLIPANAHIRLASPASNGGARLLRRGYSFTDGVDARTGELDAGLFFLSFQSDPAAFVRVQTMLASDALGEYLVHDASALFAVPRGVRPGGSIGDGIV